MSKIAAVVLALLALSGSPALADSWTTNDTLTQTAVLTALTVDYFQTSRIIRDPVDPTHLESNPVMGERGEKMSPELYFAGVAIAHTLIVRKLPQPYRRLSQVAVLLIQADAISTNWRAGYTWNF